MLGICGLKTLLAGKCLILGTAWNLLAIAPPSFNEAEKKWIEQHPVLSVGIDEDFRPFEFVTDEGDYAGLASAYLKRVTEETGLNIEIKHEKSWAVLLDEAKSGDIDLISAVVNTPDRRKTLYFSKPYASFANVIVKRNDGKMITGIQALSDKPVAVETGTYVEELLRTDYPELELKAYPTRSEALAAVATGDAYAHICDLAQATYLIRRDHLSNLEIAAPAPFSQLELRMASADPVLISIIDKVFSSISPEEKVRIEQDWVSVRYEHINYMLLGRWGFAVLVVVLVAALWIYTLQRQIHRRRRFEKELVKARQEETDARCVAENAQALEARARTHAEASLALAEEVTARKSEFLSIAAHDLKNPIGSIRGLADLLYEDLKADPNEQGMRLEIVHTIEEAADNMLELVNELLNVEAIESGVITSNDACIKLSLLIKDVVILNEPPAKKKRIELDYQCATANAVVTADAGRMLEVLDNLVNNAVKYSPPGSKVVVKLGISPDNPLLLRFSVLDEGPGLTPKDMERLFQRFCKGSARPTGDETSTGLGLAIVKTLVTQMRGRVWAENRTERKGAVFHCEFPLYDAGDPNAGTSD